MSAWQQLQVAALLGTQKKQPKPSMVNRTCAIDESIQRK